MLTQKQLDAHYTGIGGSMASSVLGLNKYQSKLDAFRILTDTDFRAQHRAEMENNIHIDLGHALENIVAKYVSIEKGWNLIPGTETKFDNEHPFLLGNIDFSIDGKKELAEIKVRGQFAVKQYGEEGTDQVHDSDFVQCQHYLKLYDYERAHLCCLDLGMKQINYYVIERDDSFIDTMRPVLIDFWENNVKKMIAPEPSTYEEASAYWHKSHTLAVYATPEIEKIVQRARKTGIVKRRLDQQEKELKLQIAKFMQDGDMLFDQDGVGILTYKTQLANRIDVTRLRAEQPRLADQYTTTSTSRVMRFKK